MNYTFNYRIKSTLNRSLPLHISKIKTNKDDVNYPEVELSTITGEKMLLSTKLSDVMISSNRINTHV